MTDNKRKALLVIDGGTTNLRGTLLDAETLEVLDTEKRDGGVRYTAIDGNNARLRSALADAVAALASADGGEEIELERTIAYGMITSNLGLCELPHLEAPASLEDLRNGMHAEEFPDIAPGAVEFIPGVRNFYGSVDLANVSAMDMMRGEETEAVGLYTLLGLKEEALFVLPGSHNKFVHMGEDGEILGCMTSISGELLDAVTHHTILAGSTGGEFCTEKTYDAALALAGAGECRRSGLGRAAFSGRILQTAGGFPQSAIPSYLLGAVLAEDEKALAQFLGGKKSVKIFAAGKAPLQQAVCDVLREAGYEAVRPVAAEFSAKMGTLGALTIAGIG